VVIAAEGRSSILASSALTTFPVGLTGIVGTRKICDGRLYGARCRAAYSTRSVAVNVESGKS